MGQKVNSKFNDEILEESKAAIILYENYLGSKLYTDIVESVDSNFPGWRHNHQLGKFAPLFILFIIDYHKEQNIDFTIDEKLLPESLNNITEYPTELPVDQWLFAELSVIHNQYNAYKLANRLHHHRDIKAKLQQYQNDNNMHKIQLEKLGEFTQDFMSSFNNIIYWAY